jgi:hypothetical protein
MTTPTRFDYSLPMSKASPVIDTRQLSQGLPAIAPAFGQTLVEAIVICLTERNHPPSITLKVEADFHTSR